MKNSCEAIVFQAKNSVTHGQFALEACGADEIVVKTAYTMVSPGTELRVLGGHYGAEGNYPLIPGYCVVGQVVEVGREVKGWRVGDWVTGRNPKAIAGIKSQWGGQASMHLYRTSGEDRPVLLPKGAEPRDYAIAEVAAISLRGIEAARPVVGETAVVIGQGMIGAFSAAWLVSRGCRVCVVDLEESRLERALNFGVAAAFSACDVHIAERVGVFCNNGADIVVEASGVIPGVELAYKLVRRKPQAYGTQYVKEPIGFYHGDWPRIVMQANYIDKITLNPFGFVPGEAAIIASPFDRGVEDRQAAVEAIRTKRIDPAHFIDLVAPYKQAAEAYASLRERTRFSAIFDWSGAHHA